MSLCCELLRHHVGHEGVLLVATQGPATCNCPAGVGSDRMCHSMSATWCGSAVSFDNMALLCHHL
jgi:hypothetical protein